MCFTKLRVEVEQWEDEGVFLVSRLSVESVPAGDVVQEERDEEDTCLFQSLPSAPLYSLVTRLMSV